ncbi:MAG: HAMP domain-containing histidine kinase [Mediterranea sp.]|jgi:signal transduction histidine kinase|nr:HAMP domain-containing histidine kinase [Mediterranea sp.]
MKLIYHILVRISLALTLVLTIWAVFFYVAMINEVNDEVDDSLEDYSEAIITRALAGEELPSRSSGSNNQYYLTEVSASYAERRHRIVYADSMVYIVEKRETEPARILTTIFRDHHGGYHELTVSTPTIEKEDLKLAIQTWIILLYVALLLFIILISAWVFYRNMTPLYTLLRWLDNYKTGKENEPLKNDTRITEFRKLNEATLRYVERVERAFEQQKQFIGNASHEMQTPLAICLNRLEMLMEDEALTERELGELVKLHQTLEHITKLNKSLLLLSKIDNGQFTDVKTLDLNEMLRRYIKDYEEVYDYRRIDVELVEQGRFVLTMSETLAVVMLTNLLKNAFVHNVEGGRIRVVVSRGGMTFRNTGEGALDKEHVFERFYQGAKREGSTGLGLAIVDSICRLGHLSLRYYFEDGEHCFEVRDTPRFVNLPEASGAPG